MEISPEPQDTDNKFLEFLKILIGEDALTFLDFDKAIAAVRESQPVWQAPFAIGIRALPFLYHWDGDSRDRGIPDLVLVVLRLASQIDVKSKDATASDLVHWALDPLEAKYNSLNAEIPRYGFTDEQARVLFHTRFALGVLLLIKGDEERAKTILRQMADTKTTKRGPTWSSEGLGQFDVGITKVMAAVILEDFYARRQDYELALYLLMEAVASNGPGPFSESLIAAVPRLLESFADKCERVNDFGEWVDLFDRAAGITAVCGDADVDGELPSNCKVASPQFLAWKFGQLVARFVICNSSFLGDNNQLLISSNQGLWTYGYGSDWLNGTVVASLLLDYDEYRNWQVLRQQYISMWEALPSYQWLSLSEAGTQTDLYWAMKIGFVDQMLSTTEQKPVVQRQTETTPIGRTIERLTDIDSAIALRQMKLQQGLEKMLAWQQKTLERLPPTKQETVHQLQQRLSPVWNQLPPKVVGVLGKAEKYYRTGVDTSDAKVWFNKAVEASLNYCFVEPLVNFMQKRGAKRIAICFPPPRGIGRETPRELGKLSLSDWSYVFNMLSVPADKSVVSLGTADLTQFLKEHFGKLPPPALRELSRSLRDFCCLRKDTAHYHPSRYEQEIQELEQMRELALGIKRPSVIAQIFQLFSTAR